MADAAADEAEPHMFGVSTDDPLRCDSMLGRDDCFRDILIPSLVERRAEKDHEIHKPLQPEAKDREVALLQPPATHPSRFNRYSSLVVVRLLIDDETGGRPLAQARLRYSCMSMTDAISSILSGS